MTGRRLTGAFLALAVCGFSAAFALAAEPTLTPRAAGTPLLPAFTPVGVPKGAPKLDPARPWSPPPRLPASLGPLLFGAGGGVAVGVAESAVRVPFAVSPPPQPAPVFSPPAPVAPAPVAVAKPPANPSKSAGPAKTEPAAKGARAYKGGGRGDGEFAEWENGCMLPEELDNPPPRIAPGMRLLARVDSFQRAAPSCRAHIRGVLLAGEPATALADNGDGWVKVRDRWGAVYWVGARLLAPAPQR